MAATRTTFAMVASGRVVGEPRPSPDAALVAFVAVTGGRATLVVVPARGGAERVLSTEPAPIGVRVTSGAAFDWLPDGSGLVYAALDGGLWRQAVDGSPPVSVVPRPATGSVSAPAVAPDGARVAFLVDGATVCVAAIADDARGWPVPLSHGNDFALDPTWSPDGRMVAWHEWDVPAMPWDASRIAVRPADRSVAPRTVAGGGSVAADGRPSPDATSVSQPRFAPDGRLGFLSDEGGWLHLRVLPATLAGPSTVLVGDDGRFGELGGAAWGPGLRDWCWSPDGRHLLVRSNVDGFGELLVVPAAERGGAPVVVARAVHACVDWRGDLAVAVRTGARTPHRVVAYDLSDPARERPPRIELAHGPVAGWVAADPPEPEVVRWTAADGATITGRLHLPRGGGSTAGPPPLLCWVHGGPTDQWPVVFNPRLTAFVDRGWAVLVADHRGSTGHGRAHQQAMHGRWGELDADDCAAGIEALAAAGRIDGHRVAVTGSSAGGYAALRVAARHPRLVAAVVALSAVADLFDLAERSHRFERHYPTTLVGPLPAAAGRYRDMSPVSDPAAIEAPVLLLHGSDDEVVPVGQACALADGLRRAGRTVELHVYDGEGHGWGRPEVVLDELHRVDRFLRRWVLERRPPAGHHGLPAAPPRPPTLEHER